MVHVNLNLKLFSQASLNLLHELLSAEVSITDLSFAFKLLSFVSNEAIALLLTHDTTAGAYLWLTIWAMYELTVGHT